MVRPLDAKDPVAPGHLKYMAVITVSEEDDEELDRVLLVVYDRFFGILGCEAGGMLRATGAGECPTSGEKLVSGSNPCVSAVALTLTALGSNECLLRF